MQPNQSSEDTSLIPYQPVNFQQKAEELNKAEEKQCCAAAINIMVPAIACGLGSGAGQLTYDLLSARNWTSGIWYGLRMGVSGFAQTVIDKTTKWLFLPSKKQQENQSTQEQSKSAKCLKYLKNLFTAKNILSFLKQWGATSTWWGVTDFTDKAKNFAADQLNLERVAENAAAIATNEAAWEALHGIGSYAFIKRKCGSKEEIKAFLKRYIVETAAAIAFWFDGPLPFPSPPGSRDVWGGTTFPFVTYLSLSLLFECCKKDSTPRELFLNDEEAPSESGKPIYVLTKN